MQVHKAIAELMRIEQIIWHCDTSPKVIQEIPPPPPKGGKKKNSIYVVI